MSESPSACSTPSHNAFSQPPPASHDILFTWGSDYTDLTYGTPTPNVPTLNSRALSINTARIDMIRQICGALVGWTSSLGPVGDWPCVFWEQYNEACIDTTASTTQATIDTFLKQVQKHVMIRKEIIAGFESCAVIKLSHSECPEEDFLLVGDLMRTLHWGVALLEVHLELHAPS